MVPFSLDHIATGQTSPMKTSQQKLDDHPNDKCPECERFTLSHTDSFDDSLDWVTRNWACRNCKYRESAPRIPITSWATQYQEKWEAKAAHRAEFKRAIRCPNCGQEKIEAILLGKEGIGASQSWQMTCRSSECNFPQRKIRRSVRAVVATTLHHSALLIAILAGAAAVSTIFFCVYQKNTSPQGVPVEPTANPALESAHPGHTGGAPRPTNAHLWVKGSEVCQDLDELIRSSEVWLAKEQKISVGGVAGEVIGNAKFDGIKVDDMTINVDGCPDSTYAGLLIGKWESGLSNGSLNVSNVSLSGSINFNCSLSGSVTRKIKDLLNRFQLLETLRAIREVNCQ